MSAADTSLEFAGDNPCVVLYDEQGNVTAGASYWNVNASLAGVGNALFLVVKGESRPTGRILTDNVRIVDFLRSFNRHFLGFEGLDWMAEPEDAQFSMQRGERSAALRCTSAKSEIELLWQGLDAPYLLRSRAENFGGEVGRSYEVSSVIIAASEGGIRLDGEPQRGSLLHPYGALPRSAFLAFCETWSREGTPT